MPKRLKNKFKLKQFVYDIDYHDHGTHSYFRLDPIISSGIEKHLTCPIRSDINRKQVTSLPHLTVGETHYDFDPDNKGTPVKRSNSSEPKFRESGYELKMVTDGRYLYSKKHYSNFVNLSKK